MIRNAFVKKANTSNPISSASSPKVMRTTTAESLLGDQNIQNAEQLYRYTDNRNGRQSVNLKRPPVKESGQVTLLTKRGQKTGVNLAQAQAIAGKATDVANAASAAWFVIGTTWILYMVQLVFSVLSLIGLVTLISVDGSWLGYVDFMNMLSGTAEDITYIGMAITATMGIFTMILAIMVFTFRGVNIGKGYSLPILGVCFALNATPGTSLVPWIWAWCLYVVKSQINNK